MKRKLFSVRTLFVIITILLIPTSIVLGQEIISSAEPGYVNSGNDFTPQVIGDDPDEDGYTGPIYLGDGTPQEPSGEGIPLDPSFFNPSGVLQPDDNGYIGPEGQSSTNGWSNFYYLNVAGSSLRPRNSNFEWYSDSSGGCMYPGGAVWNNIDVQLPDGARVDYLRLYYYDTNSSNSIAWITSYDTAGNMDDMVNVQSAGNTGFGTSLSDYLGETIDTLAKAYLLNWNPLYAFDGSLKLCGLRIAYRLPTP